MWTIFVRRHVKILMLLLILHYSWTITLREKCPNTELFLVRILLYSDWIRTRNNSVFGNFSHSVIKGESSWKLSYNFNLNTVLVNGRPSSFKELLHEDNYVTMHHKIIRNLAFETIKFLHGLSTLILNEVFVEQDCDYNLGSINFLNRRRIKSVRYATKSV